MCPRTESIKSKESDPESTSDMTDSDVSMTESSDDDSSEASGVNDNRLTTPSDSQNLSIEHEFTLNEDEEEDEVIKAIIRAKNKKREHPPDIECEDYIADICFHPVEDIIVAATATGDALVYKYSNENNELLETLELHLKACRDVEFDEDGTSLFSASKDKSLMVTDMKTGKLKQLYENAHDEPIYSLLVVNQDIVASGDDDGTVKLWDLRKKDSIFSLKEMEDFVSCMVTSEAKKIIVCGSGDGTLTSLNINMRKLQMQSEQYECEFTGLSTMHNERKLVASTTNGTIYLFNWGQFGYHSDEFPGRKQGINALVPITENIIVTACEDGILRATHLFPHRHLGIAGQHQLPVELLDISNTGSFIASCGHDQLIKFWNISYFEEVMVDERKKKQKGKKERNLPSSKYKNATDFFAELE